MGTAASHNQRTPTESEVAAATVEQSVSVGRAQRYCARLAKSHYENFPVGSLLIPARLRRHFYSIYAFARTADDFADEGYSDGNTQRERLDLLNEWGEMLESCFRGEAVHPIFIALRQTKEEFDLPADLFRDLLSAFAQDVTTTRYADFGQLLDYCRRSANPIGRLILLLFGHTDEQLHRWSDEICSALQLANHWQDVAVDLAKDRVYLPEEDFLRFGVAVDDLKAHTAGEPLRRLMEFEVDRARSMFLRGKPLCTAVSGRLGLELRAIWMGGWRILERIEQNRYDVLARRPVITMGDKFRILATALRREAFRRSNG